MTRYGSMVSRLFTVHPRSARRRTREHGRGFASPSDLNSAFPKVLSELSPQLNPIPPTPEGGVYWPHRREAMWVPDLCSQVIRELTASSNLCAHIWAIQSEGWVRLGLVPNTHENKRTRVNPAEWDQRSSDVVASPELNRPEGQPSPELPTPRLKRLQTRYNRELQPSQPRVRMTVVQCTGSEPHRPMVGR